MGLFDFLNGTSQENQRKNHPPVKINATGSSFTYQGEVTNEYLENDMKVRVIDKAITYKDVNDEERHRATSELISNRNQAAFAGVFGVGGGLFSTYKFMEGYQTGGIIGGLTSVGFSLFSFYRANEAHEELQKWDTLTETISKTRVQGSRDFNTLMKWDLKNKYFTLEETQDIFHGTVQRLKKEYHQTLKSVDQGLMVNYVDKAIRNNPFSEDSLEYAFNNQNDIMNPKEPTLGSWKRIDFEKITDKSNEARRDYLTFNSQTQQRLQEIYGNQALGSTAVQGVNKLANNQLSANTNEALAPFIKERDKKLAKLEKNKNKPGINYQESKEAIQRDYENHPTVKSILNKGKQNQDTANLGGLIAQELLLANTQVQRTSFFAQRDTELLNRFPKKIEEIFQDYDRTRMGPGCSDNQS